MAQIVDAGLSWAALRIGCTASGHALGPNVAAQIVYFATGFGANQAPQSAFRNLPHRPGDLAEMSWSC